jgi:hypothetical protein
MSVTEYRSLYGRDASVLWSDSDRWSSSLAVFSLAESCPNVMAYKVGQHCTRYVCASCCMARLWEVAAIRQGCDA